MDILLLLVGLGLILGGCVVVVGLLVFLVLLVHLGQPSADGGVEPVHALRKQGVQGLLHGLKPGILRLEAASLCLCQLSHELGFGLGQLGDALGLQLGGLSLGFAEGLTQLFHGFGVVFHHNHRIAAVAQRFQ